MYWISYFHLLFWLGEGKYGLRQIPKEPLPVSHDRVQIRRLKFELIWSVYQVIFLKRDFYLLSCVLFQIWAPLGSPSFLYAFLMTDI